MHIIFIYFFIMRGQSTMRECTHKTTIDIDVLAHSVSSFRTLFSTLSPEGHFLPKTLRQPHFLLKTPWAGSPSLNHRENIQHCWPKKCQIAHQRPLLMEFNQHFSSSSRETLSVLTYSLRGYLAQATVKATFQAQEGLSRMPFLTRKQTTCENRILRISCKQSNINMNHMDMIQFNKHEPHGYDFVHMNMNHMYAHMNEPHMNHMHEPHMNHMHEPHMNMICRHEHP